MFIVKFFHIKIIMTIVLFFYGSDVSEISVTRFTWRFQITINVAAALRSFSPFS